MKLKTKFQDEDFDLGEVVEASIMYGYDDKIEVCCDKKMKHRKYNSIKDLTDHWEDAPEESKGSALDLMILTFTNFIENEPDEDMVDLEDCKQMLQKLRAWQRLKDKRFKVDLWDYDGGNYSERIRTGRILFRVRDHKENDKDLDLLFNNDNDGGEDETTQ